MSTTLWQSFATGATWVAEQNQRLEFGGSAQASVENSALYESKWAVDVTQNFWTQVDHYYDGPPTSPPR
ncbi:MAG: hypothetical protein WBC53_01000, partial [Phycisphaerae bacterium]